MVTDCTLTVGAVQLLVEESHAGEDSQRGGRAGRQAACSVPLRGTHRGRGEDGEVGEQERPGGVQHVALKLH